MIRPRLRFFIVSTLLVMWIVLNVFFFRLTIQQGWGVRYAILPLAVLFLALYLGARYVHSTYRLVNLRQGMDYLFACVFGFGYPVLVIGEGKAQVERAAKNLVLSLGGPGKIFVSAGSIALVEDYRGPLRVLGPGLHFLSRYETIKEFSSLEERYRLIDKLSAHSKDGIEVQVRDIRYRYRLARQDEPDKVKGIDTLLQYSENAVIQMVYNRAMSENGTESWEDVVNGVVVSIITDFINKHMVDYLTAPKDQKIDPRAEIKSEFDSPVGRKKFKDCGAELVWIGIGHFETPEKIVAEQRVNTWQARLQGDAKKERAIGEAQRLAYQEMGRAEAQAGVLMSIIDSLESVNVSGDAHENMRQLYLARIAQFLDMMRELPK
ncbi:MAG: hypothetical protein IT316_04895 [Anaerolineales bacterium]|nr:hypothetical protein [Anaerolineales bacterium]